MNRLLACLSLLTLLIGCAAGAPPSSAERALYYVTTNYVTNLSQFAQVDTNWTDGHTMLVTNSYWVTNIYPTFQLQPKTNIIEAVAMAGSIATTSGVPWGGMASTLLTGILWAWAEFRNRNKAKLGEILAQNIETAREIFKAQPNGGKLDSAFKAEIKAQQVNAGVKAAAATVADEQVNTIKAKESAVRVLAA